MLLTSPSSLLTRFVYISSMINYYEYRLVMNYLINDLNEIEFFF